MSRAPNTDKIDDFLFGSGLCIDDYFIEQSPVSEVICYRNSERREFDLAITDPVRAEESRRRLKELGVRIVRLG